MNFEENFLLIVENGAIYCIMIRHSNRNLTYSLMPLYE